MGLNLDRRAFPAQRRKPLQLPARANSNILLAIRPASRLCRLARSTRVVSVGKLPDAIVTSTNTLDQSAQAIIGTSVYSGALDQKRAQLAEYLTAIETMDLLALRQLWAEHFGTPPTLRSTDLMRLTLSWRLQARVLGGLDAAMRRRLRRPTKADPQSAIDLPVGTKLKREWQGQSYTIEVTGEGFFWNGTTYASLSAVAKAITGTNWNGPRFFGLRKSRP